MNINELTQLNNEELTQLLINCDKWFLDDTKNQIFKIYQKNKIIFDLYEFSPFSNDFQAELVLKISDLDYSYINNHNNNWGLSVFKHQEENCLILKSNSYYKSALMFLIAVNLGMII